MLRLILLPGMAATLGIPRPAFAHHNVDTEEAAELGFTHADIERSGYIKAVWRI